MENGAILVSVRVLLDSHRVTLAERLTLLALGPALLALPVLKTV
jgi:hypothetical protein